MNLPFRWLSLNSRPHRLCRPSVRRGGCSPRCNREGRSSWPKSRPLRAFVSWVLLLHSTGPGSPARHAKTSSSAVGYTVLSLSARLESTTALDGGVEREYLTARMGLEPRRTAHLGTQIDPVHVGSQVHPALLSQTHAPAQWLEQIMPEGQPTKVQSKPVVPLQFVVPQWLPLQQGAEFPQEGSHARPG